ncbi:hypothetical protein CCMSSC00406_0007785 [Pleurotus cornucopiae]|uniref:Uncharacterized protein n=1 Tax=Pleurotus cornucopiae TaxID=5321 RepID=A0ACB7J679_PLECO|nr:hypothetical protein CCMSSC00406_0007785 [Pleurotus cornucopiae]
METRRRHRHLSESSSLYYQGVSDQGVSDWSTPVRLSGNYRPFPSVSFPPTAYTSPIDPVHEGSPIIPPEQPPDDESRRDFTVHSHPSYSVRGNQPPGSVFYGPNSGSSSRQSSPSRSTEGRADADDIKQQIHVLKDWLQRDAQDRQAELRAVAARVDQLNDQIRRLAAVPGGVQINQSELRGVAAEVGSLSEEVRRFAAARGAPPPVLQQSPRSYGSPFGMIGGPMTPSLGATPIQPEIKFHQMFLPPSGNDNRSSTLQWDMLFPSTYAQGTSSDPSAWANKREEAATSPRVAMLNLVSKAFPWTIYVRASHPQLGVSCSDVIEAISRFLGQLVSQQEFLGFPAGTQQLVTECYHQNRDVAREVLGVNGLGEGIKRLDWLGMETIFGGIEHNDRLLREICGGAPPPLTFALLRIRKSSSTNTPLRR